MKPTHYAMMNHAGSVFIKEAEFFRSQGGLVEDWGKNWVAITARDDDEAREKGRALLKGASLVKESEVLDPMALGDDAMAWAKAFVSTVKKREFETPNLWDEGYMVGWFANAIEATRSIYANKASVAESAMGYVFGYFNAKDWQEIVSKGFTPPLPLEHHAVAMGLSTTRDKEARLLKEGRDAGFAEALKRSSWQTWVHTLTIMQQSVLASAVRAPDGMRKHHPAKALVRWYRRSVLVSAFDGKALLDPHAEGGGSFTGPTPSHLSLENVLDDFMVARDEMSLHYYAHMMHAAQIVGCYHPSAKVQEFWDKAYHRMVNALHLSPETYMAMARRLSDDPKNWEERADEAASCTD